MSYKSFYIGLFLLFGLFVNKSLVAQHTADYLLADNLTVYSIGSNSGDNRLPYSVDFLETETQEDDLLITDGYSEANLVVGKGKRRGKGGNSIGINLEYDLPEKVMSGSTFLFKCKITKGDLKGMAKLTQRLPIGFDIVESVIGGAKTKYSNFTLNLVWDEIPVDNIIEISYNVVVNRSYGYLPISSVLYFEETGKKYLFNTHVLVDKEQPAEDLIVHDQSPTIESNDAGKIFVETVNTGKKSDTMPKEKYAVTTDKDEIPETNTGSIAKKSNVEKSAGANSQQTVYSIQILALMYNNVKPETLKRKYHISDNVKLERFNNWRKYTVGHFTSLSEAKASLENIKQKGLKDAFIVGYKDGYRFLAH